MKLIIYHLYPDLLDLYGDRGNVLTLASRCKWRGIDVEIRRVSLQGVIDFSEADILFLGGGSDREQGLLVEDLSSRSKELRAAIEDGLVLLTICGGYQLLGQYYQTGDGTKIPGLGILDLYTIAGNKRLIGNVVVEMDESLQFAVRDNYTGSNSSEVVHTSDDNNTSNDDNTFGEILHTLVGFENHSGKTYLGSGLKPLGKVLTGFGNNGEDRYEGVRYKNIFGTYLHGPLLPKNPHFADLILGLALKRKGFSAEFIRLYDNLEKAAHRAVVARFNRA